MLGPDDHSFYRNYTRNNQAHSFYPACQVHTSIMGLQRALDTTNTMNYPSSPDAHAPRRKMIAGGAAVLKKRRDAAPSTPTRRTTTPKKTLVSPVVSTPQKLPSKSSSPPKKSNKAALERSHQAPKLPYFEDTRKADRARLADLEKQLVEIEESRKAELKEIRDQAKQFKKESKEQIKQYKRAKAEGEAVSLQLVENQHIIDMLRKENAKIRERNHALMQNISNLKTNNERLEATMGDQSEYYLRLQVHHKRVADDNKKLTLNCEDLEERMTEIEADMCHEEDKARCEYTIRSATARTIKMITDVVENGCDQDEILESMKEFIELLDQAKAEWAPIKEAPNLPPSRFGRPQVSTQPKVQKMKRQGFSKKNKL